MSSSLTPAQVARQWFEDIWIKRDPQAISRLMAPHAKGYLEHNVTITGPEGFMPVFDTLHNTFPDLDVTIEGIVSDDHQACVRWSVRGKHAGDGMGIPATHKTVQFRGMTWMIVKDGQVVEGWDSWNQGALLRELGIA